MVNLGTEWTRGMDESVYIRQKVLLDARSAGVRYPMSGVWNPATDLEGLEAFAISSRNIGYYGLQIMPIPEHVELVNRIFTPTQDEIDYWAGITELMDEVAVDELMPDLVVEGQIIPANRGEWAKLRLALAAEFGVEPSPTRAKLTADHVGHASEHWRNLASQGRVVERIAGGA